MLYNTVKRILKYQLCLAFKNNKKALQLEKLKIKVTAISMIWYITSLIYKIFEFCKRNNVPNLLVDIVTKIQFIPNIDNEMNSE